MKKKRVFKFLVILFLVVFIYSAISIQKGEGQPVEVQQVSVIKNIGEGIYGQKIKDKIKFIKVLSLGAEADNAPDYLMFGRNINVEIDQGQNLFVLDEQNSRLMKFDQNGRFLWKASRKGQGPGEIEAPFGMKLTEDGGIAIIDQGGKINYFDGNGNFLKLVRMAKEIKSIISFSKGKIFANLFIHGQPGITAAWFSENGELIDYFPVEYYYGPKLSGRLAYDLGAKFILGGDQLYLSLPDKYEIQIYSLKGQLLRRVIRDVKIRPPFLEEGYRFVVKDISGPAQLISNGFLINELSLDAWTEAGKKYIDFFNKDFQFLGSYPVPKNAYLARVDKDDNFYFVEIDSWVKIIKYKLKID
ncbi:MAG TPA: 6-bladed beta-propeller [Candidatus Saccharicenans sp.]|jgi:hypothetical protein|nr:6-bladed beta-propeller [Candidatus Saccharicenans sp.]HRD02288.1 6-bladed beta-propeller [Candidatus Saccharicenans sp.]